MTGTDGREIYLIDLLSGDTVSSLRIDGSAVSTIDRKRDRLMYITRSGRELSYNSSTVGRAGFGMVTKTIVKNVSPPESVLSVNGRIFTAHNTGEIFVKNTYSDSAELFSESSLLSIDDFAVSEEAMAVTSPGKLLTISTDFFVNE